MSFVIFAAAALLYGLTWNGRYFHDGAFFADLLEQGKLAWCHAGYLPAGALLHAALAPLGFEDPESGLVLLSVLAGAAVPALVHASARRLGASQAAALSGALLAATAPALWFAATIVEIHVFAAAAAALALFLATARPFGPIRSAVAAALAAPLGHLSNALLLAHVPLLAARAGRRVDWRRAALAALAGAAAGVTFLAVLDRVLGPGPAGGVGGQLGFLARTLGRGFAALVLAPAAAAARFGPFGLVAPLGLLGLLPARVLGGRSRALPVPALPLWAGLLPFAATAQVLPALGGQYALPALALLALGCVRLAAALEHRPAGRALVGLVLGLQLALGVHARLLAGRDPDRRWAAQAAAQLAASGGRALILCDGPRRARRLRKDHGLASADAWLLTHQDAAIALPALEAEAAKLARRGVSLYLDRRLLEPRSRYPLAAPLRARYGRLGPAPLLPFPPPRPRRGGQRK